MGVGIHLPARSNADIASAAIVSPQAGVVQAQLAYTRDFEREADRVGFQAVENGLDVPGVADFFDRLPTPCSETAGTGLSAFPLTVERLSGHAKPGTVGTLSAGRQ